MIQRARNIAAKLSNTRSNPKEIPFCSSYPFLVSRLCQLMDEEISAKIIFSLFL